MSTNLALRSDPAGFGAIVIGTTDAMRIGGASGDNSGQLAGFRNKLINGSFDVWQRGTSQSAIGYGSADRWSFNVTTGAFTASKGQDAYVPYTDSGSYLMINASSVTGGYFSQTVEDVRTLSGRTATVSFRPNLVSGTDTGGVPFLSQHFGTGGSSSVDVYAISDTASGGTRSLVFNVPTTAGKTIGASSGLILFIPFSGTFIKPYYGVQLEAGSIATPFELRPIGFELALCQRYYEKLMQDVVSSDSTAVARVFWFFKVTKRATPVLTPAAGSIASYGYSVGTESASGATAGGFSTITAGSSVSAEL